ncbi:Asp23/Gls24 family envelope stress response protein [Rothia sp. P5766]|uniref:Asp23/Gls24 family envelope stress response protein n=1 Tax=unclassified Rothia (in: high G+C Gram-positive bacteria) TaxID=2689056 RepID=UPI003AC4F416
MNQTPATTPATLAEKKNQAPVKNTGAATGQGTTSINDGVVAKIAGIALRDVEGVYDLGGGAARAMGALRSAVGQDNNLKQGISVEVGQTQAAVDLSIIVEYPHPIYDVAENARKAVVEAIQSLAGLEVTEVNIEVLDVHVPGDDQDAEQKNDEQESRVK